MSPAAGDPCKRWVGYARSVPPKERRPSREPAARGETRRAALHAALADGPHTARELSGLTGMPERDVVVHLEHLARSLRREGIGRLVVEPARCVACAFSFSKRDRLTRPSRCPVCKSERLEPPRFWLERGPDR